MSDDQTPDPKQGGDTGREIIPPVAVVMEKTTRFSREVIATMISLGTAAFGFVAALAWNSAVTETFKNFTHGKKLSAFYIYAAIVTVIGVVLMVMLGRLAARIKAEPIEFKYPGTPRS